MFNSCYSETIRAVNSRLGTSLLHKNLIHLLRGTRFKSVQLKMSKIKSKIKIAVPAVLASLILGSFTLPSPVKAQSGDYTDCMGMYHTDGNAYDLSYDSQGAYYSIGNAQRRPRKGASNLRQEGSCGYSSQSRNNRTRTQSRTRTKPASNNVQRNRQ